MSWRPHGHVRVNSRNPRSCGVCDRCSRLFNLDQLQFQWEWQGIRLQNLRILVCLDCLDTPNEQLRARILSPDPVPVFNPRPEPFYPSGVGYEQTVDISTESALDMAGLSPPFQILTEDFTSNITIEGTNTVGQAPFPPPPPSLSPTPWFFIF